MITREQAAVARGAEMRAPADRPRQRRNSDSTVGGETGLMPRVFASAHMELRAAGPKSQQCSACQHTRAQHTPDGCTGDGCDCAQFVDGTASALSFEGIASATEKPYEMWDMFGPYTEVIAAGAFARTLMQPDLDVTLVLAHDQMRRIARTTSTVRPLQLDENGEGLHVLAPSLNPCDADVQYMAPKFADGLYDEMSFAFQITSGVWSPDFTIYRITEVDINRGDVAIVGFGANPSTSGSLRHPAKSDPLRAALFEMARPLI